MITLLGNVLALLALAILLHVFAARALGAEWAFVGDVIGVIVLLLGGGAFLRDYRAGRSRGRESGRRVKG